MKLLRLALVTTFLTSTTASAATIYVDFQHAQGVAATGYVVASSGQGVLVPFTDPAPIDLGNGYGLTVAGTYTTYSHDEETANPVDEDGWELVGDSSTQGTFTLSGLSAGDVVTMYATNAWDDFGVNGAIVSNLSFGGNPAVDILAGDFAPPGQNDRFGDTTDTSFFTLVASGVVSPGGSLSGIITKNPGPGQFGAFVFEITPVPEPTTAVLLLGGCAALGAWRRRAD